MGRMRHLATIAIAAVAALSQLACGAEPSKRAVQAPSRADVDKNWKSSALWLYATPGLGGGRATECRHVHEQLKEESRCKGKLCRHGGELASEWLEKCPKLTPKSVDEVSELQGELSDRAEGKATDCSRELKDLLGDGCEPSACLERAQRWATECAESEGGPLTVRMLERAAERNSGGERVRLDTRGCKTLRGQLREGASCADETLCKKAHEQVKAHRERCEQGDDRADIGAGVWQLAIAEGAAREPETLKIADDPAGMPDDPGLLALEDGSGALLRVCYERVTELDAYLKARDGCAEGSMLVARAQPGEDSRLLLVGRVYLPTPAPLTVLLPNLHMRGEYDHRQEKELAELRSELAAVLEASEADSANKLLKLAHKHANWIGRSQAVREVVTAKDAALAPILKKLAATKVRGSSQVADVANLRGLLHRARTRPFADLRLDGEFGLGADTNGFFVNAGELLPEAMAGYRKALKPLERTVRRSREPKGSDLRIARDFGAESARACGAAQKQMRQLEKDLLACVFDLEGCDPAKQLALAEQWGAQRDAATRTRRALDIAMGVLGKSSDQLASDANCEQPWW